MGGSARLDQLPQAILSMPAAGAVTFGLLYCVQPLMPAFSRDYGLWAGVAPFADALYSLGLLVALRLYYLAPLGAPPGGPEPSMPLWNQPPS